MNKLAALLKNNIARVIFVLLANKYGTTFLPQLLPSNGGFLSIIIQPFRQPVALDNLQVEFLAAPKNEEVLKLSLVKGFNGIVTGRIKFLCLEKQAFSHGFLG